MLIGEFLHTIDSKRRLSLPSKLRKTLGDKVVVTRGLDSKCLNIFPLDEWERFSKEIASLPQNNQKARDLSRFFLSGAYDLEVDSAGRILIPDRLFSFAEFKEKVVLTGLKKKVELWDESRWNEYMSKKEAESVSGSLVDGIDDLYF